MTIPAATAGAGRGVFMRMFSSALASQALLSAASFFVSLLLIRHTSDLQYGYFILVSGTLLLAVSLQNSFIAPAMINRMSQLSPAECGDLTGGLYREQRRVIGGALALGVLVALVLRAAGVLENARLLLVLAALASTAAALRREYFRMVLLAYRRAFEVLRGDVAYCLLLVAGVLLATSAPAPATVAVLALAAAATVAGAMLSRVLRRVEAWNPQGAPGILRQIAPLGSWSTAGAAIHWSFSQGYTWLVVATLEVSAVAAIAATRLLAMPVNLLTTGIGSVMLPLVARWLHQHGAPLVLRRLCWIALAIASAALLYFAVVWILRDWIFAVLLHKNFAQRDPLLLLWSAAFVLMAVNQQLLWLLVARARFRRLTSLGLVSAAIGLSSSYFGMLAFGSPGAPLGILVGEMVNTFGLSALCLHEAAPPAAARLPEAALP